MRRSERISCAIESTFPSCAITYQYFTEHSSTGGGWVATRRRLAWGKSRSVYLLPYDVLRASLIYFVSNIRVPMASKKKTASKKSASTVSAKAPLRPLGDRVVVRKLTDHERGTTTASGIIIPDSAQEKASEGIVVAVGPGRTEDGVRVPVSLALNDRVLFSKYGHEEVKVGGVEYLIVSEANILAIIN